MTDIAKSLWIAALAKFVAPMDPVAAARAMAPMLPSLAVHPDAMFTPASAQYVACNGRVFEAPSEDYRGNLKPGVYGPLTRVPTFGELDGALGRWWRQERERQAIRSAPVARTALPAPAVTPNERPLEAVRQMVNAFVQERAAVVHREPVTRPKTKPLPLSDGQLLAVYEARAKAGDASAAIRVAAIKRRLQNA